LFTPLVQDLMCMWQVTFLGDGPLGQMTTIATEKGFVKGFVGNPSCDPPLKPTGKLDVGTAVGSGVLSVVRNHSDWKQPYIGTVPIYSGEVAEDIAHYLADSEQVSESNSSTLLSSCSQD
jgi:molecular chaperone Hsp33